MSKIVGDIVDNVIIKPNKFKLVIKWIITGSITLIGGAFIIGQLQTAHLNRLDNVEKALNDNTKATEELKREMNQGFTSLNTRIDKVYSDGQALFFDFQDYNRKQLELIIDYGDKDREMLKRILDLSMSEARINVQSQVEQARRVDHIPTDNMVIAVRPSQQQRTYLSLNQTVTETGDTIFQVIGTTQSFINNIDTNRYKVGQPTQNLQNPNLLDVIYVNK